MALREATFRDRVAAQFVAEMSGKYQTPDVLDEILNNDKLNFVGSETYFITQIIQSYLTVFKSQALKIGQPGLVKELKTRISKPVGDEVATLNTSAIEMLTSENKLDLPGLDIFLANTLIRKFSFDEYLNYVVEFARHSSAYSSKTEQMALRVRLEQHLLSNRAKN